MGFNGPMDLLNQWDLRGFNGILWWFNGDWMVTIGYTEKFWEAMVSLKKWSANGGWSTSMATFTGG
jgi:hypothetical protein